MGMSAHCSSPNTLCVCAKIRHSSSLALLLIKIQAFDCMRPRSMRKALVHWWKIEFSSVYFSRVIRSTASVKVPRNQLSATHLPFKTTHWTHEKKINPILRSEWQIRLQVTLSPSHFAELMQHFVNRLSTTQCTEIRSVNFIITAHTTKRETTNFRTIQFNNSECARRLLFEKSFSSKIHVCVNVRVSFAPNTERTEWNVDNRVGNGLWLWWNWQKKRKKEREEEVKSCDEQDNLMPKRAHNVCTRRKLFQQWLNELQTI